MKQQWLSNYICFVHSPCKDLGSHSSTNLCGPFYVSTAPSKDKRCRPGEPLDKTLPESLHTARKQSLGVKYSLQCCFTLTHTHTLYEYLPLYSSLSLISIVSESLFTYSSSPPFSHHISSTHFYLMHVILLFHISGEAFKNSLQKESVSSARVEARVFVLVRWSFATE